MVGCIVFPSLFFLGLFYTFGKHFWQLDYSLSKQLAPIIRSTNLLLDGFANAGAGELLNDVYKVNGVIQYGKWYQTISAVTGLLLLHEKDTKLRKFLDKVLGRDHCTDAISKEDLFFYETMK